MGGLLLLLLNQVADVDSGLLWLTTPAAIVLLALRRWRRRRGGRPGPPGQGGASLRP